MTRMGQAPPIQAPVMRYHGGKYRIADWVIAHFPPPREYDTYIEPFGGAGSVLLRKAPSPSEVYNDRDGEIVNVFRVLREPSEATRLTELLAQTPYARHEFELSYRDDSPDPVERARRTLFRAAAGFGSAAATKGSTGFRGVAGIDPASYWRRYPDHIAAFCERLKHVVVENRPAIDLMQERDGPRVLHYVDPPYVTGSRVMPTGARCYRHEMTDDDHAELIDLCRRLEGFVVLSGYHTTLYRKRLKGWTTVRRRVAASGNRGSVARTECLWLSPRVVAMQRQPDLFAGNGASIATGRFDDIDDDHSASH